MEHEILEFAWAMENLLSHSAPRTWGMLITQAKIIGWLQLFLFVVITIAIGYIVYEIFKGNDELKDKIGMSSLILIPYILFNFWLVPEFIFHLLTPEYYAILKLMELY